MSTPCHATKVKGQKSTLVPVSYTQSSKSRHLECLRIPNSFEQMYNTFEMLEYNGRSKSVKNGQVRLSPIQFYGKYSFQ